MQETAVAQTLKFLFGTVMYFRTENTCADAIQRLRNALQGFGTATDYLKNTYSNRVGQWALVHRRGYQMSSGHIVNFHQ
ncbi:hypothetical protein BV898_16409 [Hypsibius exemplaris]|uniref:Uncharacterized protein n=1 Tax=Hypsibius exemplaris TaxID=2072580 RepID=A0A9X6RL84_HYPEX|nr:hypothetical protein BV898_16409 [Hypsibius exemplaris]